MKNKKHLPILGVGPIYVLITFFITIVAIILHINGYLSIGYYPKLRFLFIAFGFIFIITGIYIWIKAVVASKMIRNIKEGKLITTGIYSIVRHPVYSAFTHLFTGLLLLTSNIIFLILPIIYTIFLSVLLSHTEEKWLLERFDEEYQRYALNVNRIWLLPKTFKGSN